MSYENKDSEKVYEQIDQAIKLSPANAKAYKFAIDYSNRNNNKEKFKIIVKGIINLWVALVLKIT